MQFMAYIPFPFAVFRGLNLDPPRSTKRKPDALLHWRLKGSGFFKRLKLELQTGV